MKGQATPFGTIIVIIVFLIIFSLALAPIVGTMMGVAVTMSGMSGLEAFLYDNFVLIILIIFVIAIFWWTT